MNGFMLLFALQLANAQSDVPKSVMSTFNSMFESAEEVYWDEYDEEFLASFYFEDHNVEASFSESGKWLRTTTYLSYEELPEAARTFIEKKYPDLDYEPTGMKIQNAKGVRFSVGIETDTESIDLLFDESGKLVK